MKIAADISGSIKLVIFKIDSQQFALSLNNVERVIQIVDIIPVADIPDFISGIINFQGEFIPVADVRKVFNLIEKEVDLSDQLIIVNTPSIKIALWVDETNGIIECNESEINSASKIMLHNEQVKGILKLNNEMVLLQNLELLLTTTQVTLLQNALGKLEKQMI